MLSFKLILNHEFLLEVYYKPTCITCKRTLTELDRLKANVNKRDIFKDPLSESEIKKILKLTGLSAKEILRKRDKMYKELNLDNTNKTEQQLIKLMAKHPGLLRRPIIISKKKVFVGKVNVKEIK